MKIEKKHLPELANIMNNWFKALDSGFDKLDYRGEEEFIWFTCKIVQKAWTLYVAMGTKSPAYYSAVRAQLKHLDSVSSASLEHART